MCDAKEYVALQQECERLRAENQRLNKCLARYRAKYGELSEPDKGGEIGALSAEALKAAQPNDIDIVTNQSPSEEKIKLFRSLFRGKLLTDAIEHRGIKTFLLIGKEAAKLKREKLAAIAAAGQAERFVIVAVGRYVGGRI